MITVRNTNSKKRTRSSRIEADDIQNWREIQELYVIDETYVESSLIYDTATFSTVIFSIVIFSTLFDSILFHFCRRHNLEVRYESLLSSWLRMFLMKHTLDIVFR